MQTRAVEGWFILSFKWNSSTHWKTKKANKPQHNALQMTLSLFSLIPFASLIELLIQIITVSVTDK